MPYYDGLYEDLCLYSPDLINEATTNPYYRILTWIATMERIRDVLKENRKPSYYEMRNYTVHIKYTYKTSPWTWGEIKTIKGSFKNISRYIFNLDLEDVYSHTVDNINKIHYIKYEIWI